MNMSPSALCVLNGTKPVRIQSLLDHIIQSSKNLKVTIYLQMTFSGGDDHVWLYSGMFIAVVLISPPYSLKYVLQMYLVLFKVAYASSLNVEVKLLILASLSMLSVVNVLFSPSFFQSITGIQLPL